jgi:hypothetical protein
MIYPVIPEDKRPIISVENNRCIVSRYVQTAPYTFRVQPAQNWEDLESAARVAVEDQVGAITGDDHYPCPDDLAAGAVWPE